MSKETTPMQDLIESVGNMAQGLNEDELYDYVIRKATELLESEKHMVVDAYNDGVADSDNDYYNEQYFKETYEQ